MKTIDTNIMETLDTISAFSNGEFPSTNPITILKNRLLQCQQILEYLKQANRPLRCKEIAENFPEVFPVYYPDGHATAWCSPSRQAISALLKYLLKAKMVERVQIGTEIIRGHIQVPIYGYRLAAVEG